VTAATKVNAAPAEAPSQPLVDTSAPSRKAPRKVATKTVAKTATERVPKAAVKNVAKPASVKEAAAPRSTPVVKVSSPARKAADEKEQPAKKPKHKLVRDSFTMPSNDFQLIDQLKQRALGFKRPAKKSELLRAGLHALLSLSDAKLKTALDALDPLKPGRPRKTPV
jgi:hypothetical protein